MTITDVIATVRKFVNDDSAKTDQQKKMDAEYTVFITNGMRWIFDNIPESRIAGTGGSMATFVPPDPNNPTSVLSLSDTYFNALTMYGAYAYYSGQGGDARDQKRQTEFWDKFKESFTP